MIESRHILHVDMDAFFASVEQLDHPQFRGKPVLVGHDGPRGVVAAASYESRRFGCRSAMPMAVAKRLCPHAIITPGRFDRYRDLSHEIQLLFEHFTPIVEPVSIDEAYLDVTDSIRLHGEPVTIARNLKQLIHGKTGLTASVGVAGNKFLAKLASDMNKPDGLMVITAAEAERILPGMAVGRLWGIGPKTEQHLNSLGIKTIADLRRMPLDWLEQQFGSCADHYLELAHGRDDRPVVPDSSSKSIGHEQTFGVDIGDPNAVRDVLVDHVEQVAWRLRRHQLLARRVSLKIRFGDFKTISRSRTLNDATDSTDDLLAAAHEVFDEWARDSFSPVRLIGMSAEGLGPPSPQLDLFIDPQDTRAKELDQALDTINARFGKRAIHRAGH
jgi:DNA polymerase-4